MTPNQSYTPKYWVVNDPNSDDVYVRTMDKSRDGSANRFIEIYDENPFDKGLEVILVEVCIVAL